MGVGGGGVRQRHDTWEPREVVVIETGLLSSCTVYSFKGVPPIPRLTHPSEQQKTKLPGANGGNDG